MWLDGGDQFQGKMEVFLSEGNVMKDYYNYINLNGITIGNHEFDYSIEKLKKYILEEKFQILSANLHNKKFGKYIWDGLWKNVEPFQIFTLCGEGEIKIRIRGIFLLTAELYYIP